MSKPWTEAEINILKEYYPNEGIQIIERLPNRSITSIYTKAHRLCIETHFWDINEVSILEKYYPLEGIKVAKRFPYKTKKEVENKAYTLKLHVQKSEKNVYDISGEYGVGYTSNTNKPFYFDLDKYDLIKYFSWFEKDGYAFAKVNKKKIGMHRLVIGEDNIPKNMCIDHINHNRCDNRLCNLRIVTFSDNCKNRERPKNSTSVYVGVEKLKSGKYKAQIGVNNSIIRLGTFDTAEEAIKAKIDAEKKYFGEFRNSNLDKLINNEANHLHQTTINSSEKVGAWTSEEIKLLEELYPLMGTKCCVKLNRDKKSVMDKAKKLKIKYINFLEWTQDEINILKQWYPIEGTKCKDKLPNRSKPAIKEKCQVLKIKYIGKKYKTKKCHTNKSNTEEYTQVNLFDEQEER